MADKKLVMAARLASIVGVSGSIVMVSCKGPNADLERMPKVKLSLAPPSSTGVELSAACLASKDGVSFGGNRDPIPGKRWLENRVVDKNKSRTKLCYLRGNDECKSIAELPSSCYDCACCYVTGVHADKMTVEQISSPAECAGVQACCYEGPSWDASGPGRALSIGGTRRVSAVRGGTGWG